MVVKEDGTKWACGSCLKGHRVSGCTHIDRELFYVPKKGRPVTQCPHCRSERKKRSAHVKCDCGEKPHPKEKCIHLREAEAKAAAAAANTADTTIPTSATAATDSVKLHTPTPELTPLPEDAIAEDVHCCCPHGGQCTCATLRKDTPEDSGDSLPKPIHPRPKPRLTSHQSEGQLTVFANGHHKPVHRHNNAAHESGAPYKLPRSHTTHGVARGPIARRSVDSLASLQSASQNTWLTLSSTNHVPASQENFNFQSERGSPQSDVSTSHQSIFDPSTSMNTVPYTAPESSSSISSAMFQDFGYPSTQSALSVTTTSTEPAMSAYSMPTSALEFGSNPSDFWSNVDWTRMDGGGANFEPQPALTNASSGTISEIDDIPGADDLCNFEPQYSIEGQSQMSNLDFSNDFSDNTNFAGSFNPSAVSSNRWSMPVFSSQDNNVSMPDIPVNTPPKDLSNQAFGMPQPAVLPQHTMTSAPTSAQSQSPVPAMSDNMYQGKQEGLAYDWEQLIPGYSAGVVPHNEVMGDTLGYPVGGSTPTLMADVPATSAQSSGNFDSLDNGYRTMQWDDGMSVPTDQEYNYFDPNWCSASYNNPWS